MSVLRDLLDDYLTTRRALGFTLAVPGRVLGEFVDFMDDAGETTIRHDLAVSWAARFSRGTVLARLNTVRQFAEHIASFAPATEVPILDGRPYVSHRPRPHIYTSEQIDTLLRAAGRLTPEVRAATWQTLLGLLAVTGLRISEARGLNDADITSDEDGDGGWVRVTESKFGKSRIVPVHATTMSAIGEYQRLRDKRFPIRRTEALFVTRRGDRLATSTSGQAFRQMRDLAGMTGTTTEAAARLHDFRHSFATNMDAITKDRTIAVRVEVRESDGSVFTDILRTRKPRRAVAPSENPVPETRRSRHARRVPRLAEVAAEGFVPGEDVAVATIVSHTDATGTGQARALIDLDDLPEGSSREVILLGRISGTFAVRRLT